MSDSLPALDAVPRRATGSLEAEVDGDLVLLSPQDLGYFGADGVGPEIWALVDGVRSVEEIVRTLEKAYEAEPGVIENETRTFLASLEAAGLVAV